MECILGQYMALASMLFSTTLVTFACLLLWQLLLFLDH